MKKLITLSISILFASGLNAQVNWLQGAGGNSIDEAADVIHDASGNIYTCGYFSQSARFDNIIVSANGHSDIFVSKQDANGTFQWVATAGGLLDDKATGIALLPSGEIVITGNFRGTGIFGTTTLTSSAGSQDLFIARLNAAGSFTSANSYGGPGTDLAYDISTDGGGSIIVAGQFKGESTFGSSTFNSMNYPLSMPGSGGTPSYDAFVMKTLPSGSVLWAKQGAAPYDDRLTRVGTSSSGDIFLSGQFSDTITFASSYPNNAFNAGMLMKLDATGNELWLRRVLASQVSIYDMKLKGSEIYLTGDFSGTLIYKGTPDNYLNGSAAYKVFLLKVSAADGSFLNGTREQSENMITSRAVMLDGAGSPYIAGNFRCSFSSFSDIHGNSAFNSIGFRDVFLIRYNGTLTRQWERHFGGIGEDIVSSGSAYGTERPVIAGSYTDNFNIPEAGNFQLHVNNTVSMNSNYGKTLCSNSHAGKFITQENWGNKDILITQPYDPACPLYEYYNRANFTCTRDTLMPVRLPSTDSLFACDSIKISIETPTTADSIHAPDWVFQWSNGSTGQSTTFYSSGLYTLTYGFADECRVFTDTFHVTISPTPPIPTVMAYGVNMMSAIPLANCLQKASLLDGDTALFVAGGLPPGFTVHWVMPGGGIVNNDSIASTLPGDYYVYFTSPGGICQSVNCVSMISWSAGSCTSLTLFEPDLILTDTIFEATDTVSICFEDHFGMQLVDINLFAAGLPTTLYTFCNWNISGGFNFFPMLSYPTTFGEHIQSFKGFSSGPCSVSVDILDPFTSTVLTTVTKTFYLDIHTAPSNIPVITGVPYFCPGDTVTLSVSGGDSYLWSGPGIVSISPTGDNALVAMSGLYQVYSVTTDPILGCEDENTASFDLNTAPPPFVNLFPASGLICPYDSVQLTAEPGSSYVWYGPSGAAIATTQSIWVSTPGFYHYTFITPTGCALTSATAEVLEYSTPYLEPHPSSSICASGTVLIGVESNPDAVVTWGFPLSGSGTTQLVSDPGTYTVSVLSCGITTTADVTITAAAGTPVQITSSVNDTLCANDTVVLVATGGYDLYTWESGAAEGQMYVGPASEMIYLEATDAFGCISGDTISFYSYEPVTPLQDQDTTICAYANITLTANSSGQTIYWMSDLYGGSVISTGDTLYTTIGANDTAFYPAIFDGTCFSTPAIYSVSVTQGSQIPVIEGSTQVCEGAGILLYSGAGSTGDLAWITPQNDTIISDTLLIATAGASNEGVYYLISEVEGCQAQTDSSIVGVTVIALQNISASSLSFCAGDTIDLNSDTITGSYLWSNGTTQPVCEAFSPGIYYYTFTDSSGCSASSDTITLVMNALPTPATCNDTTVCIGTPLSLTAVSPFAVQWLSDSDSLLSTSATYNAGTIQNALTLTIVTTDTNSCSNETIVSVNLQAQLPSPLLSTSDTVCVGDTVSLTASGLSGYTYFWNGPNGTSSAQNIDFTPIQLSDQGSYSLYAVNGYCITDTASINITVQNIPGIIVTNNPEICIGQQITLFAAGNIDNYSWSNGSTDSTITVSPAVNTLYWVTANNNCGTITQNIYVTVHSLPSVSITNPGIFLVGETVQLSASGGVMYAWSPSTGLSCTDCADPTFTVNEDQLYYVTVTDTNGCVNTSGIAVDAEVVNTLYIPNAFTPDADGLNDRFVAIGNNISELRMQIYDRHGNEVYSTESISEGWDGNLKTKEPFSTSSVYIYMIHVVWKDGAEKDYKGTITIVK
jgi:gliding motility-associated-like protein